MAKRDNQAAEAFAEAEDRYYDEEDAYEQYLAEKHYADNAEYADEEAQRAQHYAAEAEVSHDSNFLTLTRSFSEGVQMLTRSTQTLLNDFHT